MFPNSFYQVDADDYVERGLRVEPAMTEGGAGGDCGYARNDGRGWLLHRSKIFIQR